MEKDDKDRDKGELGKHEGVEKQALRLPTDIPKDKETKQVK